MIAAVIVSGLAVASAAVGRRPSWARSWLSGEPGSIGRERP